VSRWSATPSMPASGKGERPPTRIRPTAPRTYVPVIALSPDTAMGETTVRERLLQGPTARRVRIDVHRHRARVVHSSRTMSVDASTASAMTESVAIRSLVSKRPTCARRGTRHVANTSRSPAGRRRFERCCRTSRAPARRAMACCFDQAPCDRAQTSTRARCGTEIADHCGCPRRSRRPVPNDAPFMGESGLMVVSVPSVDELLESFWRDVGPLVECARDARRA